MYYEFTVKPYEMMIGKISCISMESIPLINTVNCSGKGVFKGAFVSLNYHCSNLVSGADCSSLYA